MSDYKTVNGKKVRACKYSCGQMLAWDNTKNYFIEPEHENQQHTPDRCKAFKEIKQDPKKEKAVETLKEIVNVTNHNNNDNQNHKEITLDMVLKKLESIGIKVDLHELFKESNYIQ